MKRPAKEYAIAAWRLPWIVVGVTFLFLFCACVFVLEGWNSAKHTWRYNA